MPNILVVHSSAAIILVKRSFRRISSVARSFSIANKVFALTLLRQLVSSSLLCLQNGWDILQTSSSASIQGSFSPKEPRHSRLPSLPTASIRTFLPPARVSHASAHRLRIRCGRLRQRKHEGGTRWSGEYSRNASLTSLPINLVGIHYRSQVLVHYISPWRHVWPSRR